MSNPEDNASTGMPQPIPAAPSAPGGENRRVPPVGVEAAAIVKRKKREDTLKKCSLALRWLSFVFSFIAFVIMVSNRHGLELNFEDYEEYSYLVAIGVISSVYSAYQGIRGIIQLVNGKCTFPQPVFGIIDFIGDQILAYLLISAASAGVPWTNRVRQFFDDATVTKFLDMAAASISMAFFAFFAMALSVLISGYQLSLQFFI